MDFFCIELNKDYLGYIASQVSPPIPVETTRYFVEEEPSAGVKARHKRRELRKKNPDWTTARIENEIEKVGYWRTGPKFPLKMKSVYDELKEKSRQVCYHLRKNSQTYERM